MTVCNNLMSETFSETVVIRVVFCNSLINYQRGSSTDWRSERRRVWSRYQWTKNDRPLVVNGLGVQQVVGRGTLILTDDQPTGQHNGVYQCFASNLHGTAVADRIHLRRAS